MNGPQWTTGQMGRALSFDGVDDYVSANIGTTPEWTMMVWVNPDLTKGSGEREILSGALVNDFEIPDGVFKVYVNGWLSSGVTLTSGIWYHLSATYDGTTLRLLINGEEKASDVRNIWSPGGPLYMGRWFDGNHFYGGLIDDVRIYDRALSAEEILQLYGEGSVTVSNPSPFDGVTGVSPDVMLSWTPGDYATSHDVYFGTDLHDVNAATMASVEYMGNQDANSFDPGGLESGTTYYWRIDEVNNANANSPWKGNVWRFTTIPLTAYNPDPEDGAKGVPISPVLRWGAGFDAVSHDVYFGTNWHDVNDGDTLSNEYKGNQESNSYNVPDVLEPLTTYYWRVDEVNEADPESPWKGDVWSFRTGGLIGWWKFDEGYGDTAHDSAGENDGALINNPTWTTGQIGGALSFDGINDYVNVAHSADFDIENGVVVALWFKADPTQLSPDGLFAVIDKSHRSTESTPHWSGWVMQGDVDFGRLWFGIGNGTDFPGVETSTSVLDDVWHHIIGAFDEANIQLYLDGRHQGSRWNSCQ
jgi:hypothetical protein